ncbi:MAG: hypothetical protein EZS28_048382, partial [Streblomastix strix]
VFVNVDHTEKMLITSCHCEVLVNQMKKMKKKKMMMMIKKNEDALKAAILYDVGLKSFYQRG